MGALQSMLGKITGRAASAGAAGRTARPGRRRPAGGGGRRLKGAASRRARRR